MSEKQQNDIFGLGGIASSVKDEEEEAKWLRQHFGLPYNPFLPSGISPDAPEGAPLKDQVGDEIGPQVGQFITSAYRHRGSTQGLVVIGTYGTGKSHLLRLMHNQIGEWLGSGDEKALSIYVDRPRAEAQDLNRGILKSLGEDTVRKMLWYCIRGQIAQDIESGSETLQRLYAELYGPLFALAELEQDSRFRQVFTLDNLDDYRVFLRAYDKLGWQRENIRDYFCDLITRSLGISSPREVAEAFTALLLAPDEKARTTWESLLALGKGRKAPLLAAPEFLQDLLSLTQKNGYVYTFLLIDEFEEVPAGYLLTKRQKADYLYTVMEMLNRVQFGLGLVLAITPEAWELLTGEAPPLGQRLPTVIRLGVLDSDSIGRLFEAYLSKARQDAGVTVEDPLLPFSQDTIEEIVRGMPERTPRNILQFAYQLVLYCVTNDITSIEQETVRIVLGNFLSMKAIEQKGQRDRVRRQ